jgi:hypothetical protein
VTYINPPSEFDKETNDEHGSTSTHKTVLRIADTLDAMTGARERRNPRRFPYLAHEPDSPAFFF